MRTTFYRFKPMIHYPFVIECPLKIKTFDIARNATKIGTNLFSVLPWCIFPGPANKNLLRIASFKLQYQRTVQVDWKSIILTKFSLIQ